MNTAFASALKAVPRLANAATPASARHLPLRPFAHFPATPSTSRLLSTLPTRPVLPSAVPKRFPSVTAGAARGVATSTPRLAGSGADAIDWAQVGRSVGLAAVGALGLNFALNRETNGGLSVAESSYLNDTFRWTGVGIGITAITAKLLHGNGTAARLMAMNPWVVMGGGLVLSIGSMMGVFYTAPDSPAHYASWAAFTALQGVTLSPMFFLNPAILSRAGLYTVGALGGLCYVGATAKNDQFLYIGGPLLAGLGVLICTSLAPMLMPRMALRTLTVLENVSAYGGVALFSGMLLYDTQKVMLHARLAEQGRMARDPIRESVSLILDAINLFVRIVQVMLLQQRNKK